MLYLQIYACDTYLHYDVNVKLRSARDVKCNVGKQLRVLARVLALDSDVPARLICLCALIAAQTRFAVLGLQTRLCFTSENDAVENGYGGVIIGSHL